VVNLTETNTTLQSKFFVPFSKALGLIQELGESAKMSHSPIMPHQFARTQPSLVASFSIAQMIVFVSKENSEIESAIAKMFYLCI